MRSLQSDLPDLNEYRPHKNLLKNRFVVITGATDGIGKAISLACAAHGARLLLLAKSRDKLDDLLQSLPPHPKYTHQVYGMDFSTAGEADYIRFAKFIATGNTPINSLVLGAGYLKALQSLRNYPLDAWLRTITINLHAPFMLARCCIPSLERSDDPSIVFSTHRCTKAYWGAYGISKAAQEGMMRILADECDGDKPVRVNGVDPAPVRTKLRTVNYPGVNPQTLPAPEEIVMPYLYFIGPDSKGVTGVNYKVNPGFHG